MRSIGADPAKGFNQYFHQTPIDYIRDLRIKLIHHELQHSQAHETVTDILLRNGINSLGIFLHFIKTVRLSAITDFEAGTSALLILFRKLNNLFVIG